MEYVASASQFLDANDVLKRDNHLYRAHESKRLNTAFLVFFTLALVAKPLALNEM